MTTVSEAELTLHEAAALLGVSRQTFYRLVSRGAVRQVRLVGMSRPRYSRAQLEHLARTGGDEE